MEHNPFVAPDVDPRAKVIQDARDAQKAGEAAAVSLVPDWEKLKELTRWMADKRGGSYTAFEVSQAVEEPERYWEYMQAAKAQEAMNNGE